jgi:hypothetical protein
MVARFFCVYVARFCCVCLSVCLSSAQGEHKIIFSTGVPSVQDIVQTVTIG